MIVSPHIGQGIDGTTWRMCEQINSPLPIVPVTRVEDFKFNTDLYRLTDYILVNMCELGWDVKIEETGSAIFGKNAQKFHQFQTDEWKRFNEWVGENPPALTFHRELLKKDVTESVVPIDYFNWTDEIPIQSKEDFEKRVLDVFYFWGRSHEGRLLLHSDIWKGSTKHGYSVCDNILFLQDFVNNERGSKWCSVWMPHYRRIDISILLSINSLSKISIAPFGAGRKTFRHLESSVNSVMLCWEDNFAWAYPWRHEINCIKCEQGNEVETIMRWLQNPNLYYVYKECVKNANRYNVKDYVKNYIEKKINEVC